MTADALRRSLAGDDRLHHDDERLEVEPASVAAGGLVGSYRVKARPAVELLERRGLLTWRQARAARRLYRSYSLGICGAREADKGTGSWSPAGYSDLQLGAATDYRLGRAAVGGADWPVVFNVAVLDQTVRAYAQEHYASASGRLIGLVMNRLRGGLDRLADYHEQADDADGV
jgi:hypothetical protein